MLPRQIEMALLCGVAAAVLAGGVWLIARVGLRSLLPPPSFRITPVPGGWCLVLFSLLWVPQLIMMKAMIGGRDVSMADRVYALLLCNVSLFPLQLILLRLLIRKNLAFAIPFGLHAGQRVYPLVAAGFATLLVMFGPTLLTNLIVRLVVRYWAGGPKLSEHALIQTLMGQSSDLEYWILVSIESIVLAPIREEVFFRGAIQPWLMTKRSGGYLALGLAAMAGVSMRAPQNWLDAIIPPTFAIVVGFLCFSIEPLLPKLRHRLGPIGDYLFPEYKLQNISRQQIYRGIIGSALLFGMFHSSSWPDPIPLTILGLGLGWLAWRTQSIIGCIVCHSLFNAMTVYMLRMIALRGS